MSRSPVSLAATRFQFDIFVSSSIHLKSLRQKPPFSRYGLDIWPLIRYPVYHYTYTVSDNILLLMDLIISLIFSYTKYYSDQFIFWIMVYRAIHFIKWPFYPVFLAMLCTTVVTRASVFRPSSVQVLKPWFRSELKPNLRESWLSAISTHYIVFLFFKIAFFHIFTSYVSFSLTWDHIAEKFKRNPLWMYTPDSLFPICLYIPMWFLTSQTFYM